MTRCNGKEVQSMTQSTEKWTKEEFIAAMDQLEDGYPGFLDYGEKEDIDYVLDLACQRNLLRHALENIAALPAHPMRKKSLEIALAAIAKTK